MHRLYKWIQHFRSTGVPKLLIYFILMSQFYLTDLHLVFISSGSQLPLCFSPPLSCLVPPFLNLSNVLLEITPPPPTPPDHLLAKIFLVTLLPPFSKPYFWRNFLLLIQPKTEWKIAGFGILILPSDNFIYFSS